MSLIQERLEKLDRVMVDDREYAVASTLTRQIERNAVNYYEGKRVKGEFLGYEKPEITVYRIHHGNVLTSSNKFIGREYDLLTDKDEDLKNG